MTDKLRIRIDDVLIRSKPYENPEHRFAQIVRWLEQTDRIKCVPTILINDIEHYPNTIKLIKEKTKEGKLFPEIHGLEHIDYNALPENEIAKHLFRCIKWFENVLEVSPKIWVTPWGAESPKLTKIADAFGLTVEGVKHCWDPAGWLTIAKRTNSLPTETTVMEHWWKRGLRLQRISLCFQHGGFENAKNARPDIFNEKLR